METSRRAFLATLTTAPLAAALAKPRWFYLNPHTFYAHPAVVETLRFRGTLLYGEIAHLRTPTRHGKSLLTARIHETARNLARAAANPPPEGDPSPDRD